MFNSERKVALFTAHHIKSILFLPAVCFLVITFAVVSNVAAQTVSGTPHSVSSPSPLAAAVPANFAPQTNYLKNSAAFRQEIARLEITVAHGDRKLPITQVPRVQKDDVIKVRLLDEAVGGIKPDQSNRDWTFVVAFVNPNRGSDKQKSVSEEIRFRKSGWYREYSFVVPYDSQPVFFLYPKPNYRGKILNLVNKKYEEVQKLGDKTIEIAGAYAQINSFLNELQYVLLETQASRYGSFVTYPKPLTVRAGSVISSFPGAVNGNAPGSGSNNLITVQPPPVYNYNAFLEQTVERLARSFNIQLPACWQTANGGINYATSFGNYGSPTGSGNYSIGAGTTGNQNSFGYAVSSDLVARAQCVAKNVRLEDFDLSVAGLFKQGGIFAATQLRDKYPQLAYWISVAAAAIDFIVKAFQKSPLRIVPTIVQTSDAGANFSALSSSPASSAAQNPVKISLFAESQPSEQNFVTAYPIIVQKWQPEADAQIVALFPPVAGEPCLHAGQNILKNTDLSADASADAFTKDFKLVMSGANNFRKEFPLRKNLGLGGWELNLTREDVNALPKPPTLLQGFVAGMRGFSEAKSPSFNLPPASGGAATYEVKPEAQRAFAVGGKRVVILRNSNGCQCLQAVIYKPASGGQFVFEEGAKDPKNQLVFSSDGKEVSFEIDATNVAPGAGNLEVRNYGGETANLNLKLYPLPPESIILKINAGDNTGVLTGERLEQIKSLKIGGRKAKVLPGEGSSGINNGGQSSRAFAFEDAVAQQAGGSLALELELEDGRTYQTGKTFTAGLARPALVAGERGEIEAAFAAQSSNSKLPSQPEFDLRFYPVIPIDVSELSIVARNKLTDYDFKKENISVETRIEKRDTSAGDSTLPEADFEVIDWQTINIRFRIDEERRRLLGGRRLQFRIKDKERGDSNWYTIKQTFVRTPKIESVKCTSEMNEQCEIEGAGLDYISQISIDGGRTWYPNGNFRLEIRQLPNGQSTVTIPLLTDKKLLRIKLKDFPQPDGLRLTDFAFSNSVKLTKKSISTNQLLNQSSPDPAMSKTPSTKSDLPTPQPETVKVRRKTKL